MKRGGLMPPLDFLLLARNTALVKEQHEDSHGSHQHVLGHRYPRKWHRKESPETRAGLVATSLEFLGDPDCAERHNHCGRNVCLRCVRIERVEHPKCKFDERVHVPPHRNPNSEKIVPAIHRCKVLQVDGFEHAEQQEESAHEVPHPIVLPVVSDWERKHRRPHEYDTEHHDEWCECLQKRERRGPSEFHRKLRANQRIPELRNFHSRSVLDFDNCGIWQIDCCRGNTCDRLESALHSRDTVATGHSIDDQMLLHGITPKLIRGYRREHILYGPLRFTAQILLVGARLSQVPVTELGRLCLPAGGAAEENCRCG